MPVSWVLGTNLLKTNKHSSITKAHINEHAYFVETPLCRNSLRFSSVSSHVKTADSQFPEVPLSGSIYYVPGRRFSVLYKLRILGYFSDTSKETQYLILEWPKHTVWLWILGKAEERKDKYFGNTCFQVVFIAQNYPRQTILIRR